MVRNDGQSSPGRAHNGAISLNLALNFPDEGGKLRHICAKVIVVPHGISKVTHIGM